MTTMDRFLQKANLHAGSACWTWAGARSGSGYGQFWDGAKNIPAHWFLLDRRPGFGEQACHKCDNKICVRPSHIFIGTPSDNERDKVAKGRHNTTPGCRAMLKVRRVNHGVLNHQSVLSGADVALIKAIGKKRGRGAVLARHFGVSESVISGIWSGKRWPSVVVDAAAVERANKWTE